MSKTSHTAFFGDAIYRFDLAPPHVVRELEHVTGSGIGALAGRLEGRTFTHGDLEHVIRLGLIGGGLDPKPAARLVAAYLPASSLEGAMILAVSIVGALFFGGTAEEPKAPKPDPDAAAVLSALSEAA